MRFKFNVDRGGTFTDIFAEVIGDDGIPINVIARKLLSVNPSQYPDAPREGIRRILEEVTGVPHPANKPVDTSRIESIRMGTTVATNALLERKGEPTALVITKGFRDLLFIGNQSRPNIFDLEIRRPPPIYDTVIECDERVRVITRNAGAGEAEGKKEASEAERKETDRAAGISGEEVLILKRPDRAELRAQLQRVFDTGIRSLAVALAHSYTYPDHERLVEEEARAIGFQHVSLSGDIMPMVKLVPRGHTACADAYLTPCIHRYINTFVAGFDEHLKDRVRLLFMQSDGGLSSVDRFTGFRAVLSGPAGGVIGYSRTVYGSEKELEAKPEPGPETEKEEGKAPRRYQPVIAFDMGGTSTDCSRFDGEFEYTLENVTAGVPIQAPQLDINTVAAGGGSRLFFRSGLFVVGPESAGAHPGPMCYRKGGPLTVTDANLLLGRIRVESFPRIFGPAQNEPLDVDSVAHAFAKLADEINHW